MLAIQYPVTRIALAEGIDPNAIQTQSCPLYPSEHQRIGFNFDRVGQQELENYQYAQLSAGWFHDYSYRLQVPDDIQYQQMIRTNFNTANLTSTIGPIVDANIGAIWVLGNEPDKNAQQDSMAPADYARFYQEIYTFLKQRDPSSQVAIAGVIQATPLRLAYLDAVLAAYQTQNNGSMMPIDVMTVHGFILCETCDWGAGIPPGMTDAAALGRSYDVSDHLNMDIFRAQIIAMREWMAERGYRDRPLIVNEYGVLMPVFFEGFGYEEVRDFMVATFDFFRTAVDDEIGYAADGNRLVQQWAWFSLNAPPYDAEFPLEAGFNGELFDRETFTIKQWGSDFQQYVAPLVQLTNVQITSIYMSPSFVFSNREPEPIDIAITVENRGNLAAHDISISFAQGNHVEGTVELPNRPIGDTQQIERLEANSSETLQFHWNPGALLDGRHELIATAILDGCNPEATEAYANQQRSTLLVVLPEEDLRQLYIPVVP
ncbi:MAG: hypothetical protein AAF702_18645 [Chloroflexota bacterium]